MKKRLLGSMIALVAIMLFAMTMATSAVASTEMFERTETNFDWEVTDEIKIGVKSFINNDFSHKWIRYSVKDTPISIEYRQFKNPSIDNYRLQIKHANSKFFYWSRFEYRDIDGKENQLRYRPRIGFKTKTNIFGNPYIFVEPHYVVETKDIPLIMTYIGTKYKFKKFDLGVFVQGQSDDKYNMKRVFFGTEVLVKI